METGERRHIVDVAINDYPARLLRLVFRQLRSMHLAETVLFLDATFAAPAPYAPYMIRNYSRSCFGGLPNSIRKSALFVGGTSASAVPALLYYPTTAR